MGKPTGWGGLVVRSPLIRMRPWVSDGVWCAHESLPLFAPIAARMGTPGWWRLTADGAELAVVQTPPPDLGASMGGWAANAEVCVVRLDEYERFGSSDDAALSAVARDQPVEVLDQSGRVWLFDGHLIEAATLRLDGKRAEMAWRITVDGARAFLVGFDHKNRPRFAMANLGSRVAVDGIEVAQ